ncbi:hypothetical protein D3C74_345920 [compost metagenome]
MDQRFSSFCFTAMNNSILHNRLENEWRDRRSHEVLLYGNTILQPILEPAALNIQISTKQFDFPFQGHLFVPGRHAAKQKAEPLNMLDSFFLLVALHEQGNHIQGVEDEVRTNLALQCIDLRFLLEQLGLIYLLYERGIFLKHIIYFFNQSIK